MSGVSGIPLKAARFLTIAIAKGTSFALVPLLLLSSSAFGLDPSRQPQQYQLDHWDVKYGLPHNNIGALLQSRDGYLWIGTMRGLTRFDGGRFRSIESWASRVPRARSIFALAEGPDRSLWIGTEGSGLVRYKDDSLQIFDTRSGFPSNIVFGLGIDPQGRVYAGTADKGVAVISPPYTSSSITWLRQLERLRIQSLSVDRHGTAWTGGWQGGLMSIKPEGSGFSVRSEGLEDEILFGIMADKGDTLILSSQRGIFAYHKGKTWMLIPPTGIDEDVFITLCRDKDNNIWAGGYFSGLTRQNIASPSATPIKMTTRDGLAGDYIGCLLEDREGSVWVGTEVGLDRLSDAAVQTLGLRENLANESVACLVEDRSGDIWAGTMGGGVSRIRARRAIQNLDSHHGLLENVVLSAAFDATGSLLLGTQGQGVCVIRGGVVKRFTPAGDVRTVNAVLEAKDGTVWVAAFRGVRHYTRDGLALCDPALDSLSRRARVLLEDRSNCIWAGTEYGLLRFSGNQVRRFTVADGLPEDFITALHEDGSGRLWVGTSSGLARFKEGAIEVFRPANGLVDGMITCILEDTLGYVWLGCPQGIMRVPYGDFDRVSKGEQEWLRVLLLGVPDGMRSSECSQVGFPSGIRKSNGEIWITTTKGIAVIDPGNLQLEPTTYSVIIEGATSGQGRKYRRGYVWLPAGDNNVTIDFSLPLFSTARRPQFRYKLEGLEEGWTEAGTRQSAFYTILPPGSYTFKVMALGGNGTSPQISTLPVTVIAHFYQRRSFLIAFLLVFLTGLAGAHWYRTNRMRAQQRLLERVVEDRTSSLKNEIAERTRVEDVLRDREAALKISLGEKETLLKEVHHRVKNNLTIVTSLLSLQAGNLEDQRLQRVLRDAENRVRSMAAIHELLYRSNSLSAIDFGPYLESLVSRLVRAFGSPAVAFTVDAQGVVLDVGKAIPCALIVNELVTNSLKYAFPDGRHGQINVGVRKSGDHEYCMSVEDDGVGLPSSVDPSTASTLGMSLIGILSGQLHGSVAMSSEGGTKCTVTFPDDGEK
jgi:two-component sensor histidine kinase/ligand-binding sensor domain-containing protein